MLCGAEAQGRFLDALRAGASLAEAAKAGGRALATFYNRRKAEADFALAWDEAVETSAWASFDAAQDRSFDLAQDRPFDSAPRLRPSTELRTGSGRTGEAGLGQAQARPRKRRRLRLWGERRELFLFALATDCNTTTAAEAATVDRSTVYRLIRRDAAFAGENKAALAAGYERMETRLRRQREHDVAWYEKVLDEMAPVAPPPQDFETQIRILNRWWRPAPKPRRGRPAPPPAGHRLELAIDAIERKILSLGIWLNGGLSG